MTKIEAVKWYESLPDDSRMNCQIKCLPMRVRPIAHNGRVFAKLPLQILQIKHKC